MPNILDELKEVLTVLSDGNVSAALRMLMDLLMRQPNDHIAHRFLSRATKLSSSFSFHELNRQSGEIKTSEFEKVRSEYIDETKRLISVLHVAFGGTEGGDSGSSPEAYRATSTSPASRSAEADPNAVLHARGIRKQHKNSGFQLEPINVKVMPGKILGVVGVNGSGKSTLLDILRGETAPDKGVVDYPQLAANNEDWRKIRTQIGYVPQRSVPWSGRLRDALEYACAIHMRYGKENLQRVDVLIARHGLAAYQNHTWHQLSGGYRLRFDLVMARLHNPRLIIFDEPLANLDPVSQQVFLSDLDQLARGEGSMQPGIVLTSQHLYELESIAHEVIVLAGGRRVTVPTERPCSYWEMWASGPAGERLTPYDVKSRIVKALGILKPNSAGGSKGVWDVRVGQAACLIALAKGTTLAKISAAAETENLNLTYVRDVTRSARVDLDALIDTPPDDRASTPKEEADAP